VRQEWISPYKPYLQGAYKTYHGVADLYVYFYELGMRVLRPGGRLSFVVTNKWLKAAYGEPLRRFFAENAWVESIVDFGHAKQIFEDADVFPSIIVARKPNDHPAPLTARVCASPAIWFVSTTWVSRYETKASRSSALVWGAQLGCWNRRRL
jgi:Eco57I restriction-modification methylase